MRISLIAFRLYFNFGIQLLPCCRSVSIASELGEATEQKKEKVCQRSRRDERKKTSESGERMGR